MLRIILLRPAATDYDQQGRISGTLDLPLCPQGVAEANRLGDELAGKSVQAIYSAPGMASQSTAGVQAARHKIKVRSLEELRNIDMGLWHGKLVEELRQTQSKVYRLWQESPASICPPGGEPFAKAQQRIVKALEKIRKRHKEGVVMVVAPEPLASLLAFQFGQKPGAKDRPAWQEFEFESSEAMAAEVESHTIHEEMEAFPLPRPLPGNA